MANAGIELDRDEEPAVSQISGGVSSPLPEKSRFGSPIVLPSGGKDHIVPEKWLTWPSEID